jgi:hypothetical protein
LTFRARCAAGCEPIKLIAYGRCAPCKNFLAHRSPKDTLTRHGQNIEALFACALSEGITVEDLTRSRESKLPTSLERSAHLSFSSSFVPNEVSPETFINTVGANQPVFSRPGSAGFPRGSLEQIVAEFEFSTGTCEKKKCCRN